MAYTRIPVLDLAPELDEVGADLNAAWKRVLASGHFILGPEVEAFEREFASFLGVQHAVGVNSGTDALVIALRALGVGPGDEVITVPFTFFATAEAVSAVGATPVFVDIDPVTFTMRADLLEAALTSRTKALLPVHLYGHAADMAPIMAFARARGLVVLEDVAQALGGSYAGQRLGTFGAASAFSFFPSKNLGCLGDGGLVATNDAAVAERARMLRAHGARKKYFNEVVGYNSRLDALQAAFLRAKLPHVDRWNDQRREAAHRYSEMLRGVPGVVVPIEKSPARHVYHQYTVRVGGGRRDALRQRLSEAGIDTMVYYPRALHEMPLYSAPPAPHPATEAAAREVLSLPMWPRITPEVQQRISSDLRRFIR